MKDENDILMMKNIIRELGYTGLGDRNSNRKTFFTKTLPKSVEEIQNKTFEVIMENSDNDLLGEGVKTIIPSNITDIYTRSLILFGLQLSGHTDTLTEASNLIDELYKKVEIQNEQHYRNALDKFHTQNMELPSKVLEQIAFNTRLKIEQHMLIVMDKITQEEHLPQAVETENKQLKIALSFLTGYNGIFSITKTNIKFYFKKTITGADNFFQITIPTGAYEFKSLNNEIKRIFIDKGHYSENEYPLTIKPNFSTLDCSIEISPQGPIISFVFIDSIRNHLTLLIFYYLIIFFSDVIMVKE